MTGLFPPGERKLRIILGGAGIALAGSVVIQVFETYGVSISPIAQKYFDIAMQLLVIYAGVEGAKDVAVAIRNPLPPRPPREIDVSDLTSPESPKNTKDRP